MVQWHYGLCTLSKKAKTEVGQTTGILATIVFVFAGIKANCGVEKYNRMQVSNGCEQVRVVQFDGRTIRQGLNEKPILQVAQPKRFQSALERRLATLWN